jgi:hypothetical protein
MSEGFDGDRMEGARPGDGRFDEELRGAARALVTEALPRGVLDPLVGASLGLGGGPDGVVRSRRALPGFAAVFGAIVVLLLATAVTFAPRSPGGSVPSTSTMPTATPTPSASPLPPTAARFRTTAAIRLDFEQLRYACRDGEPLATSGPGPDAIVRESAVCLAPDDLGPFMAAVIVSESARGQVVDVYGKANFTGADTPGGREAIAATLAKAAAVVVAPGGGGAVAAWVSGNLVALDPVDVVVTSIGGLDLKLGRTIDGGYFLSVQLPAT